ncbi:ABC transporter permease [Streptomyces sp. SID3343]|uniref:ABC transporter permease n=1 Tax=Streptomyces sp. SID3343 TaxID=2690260 RepID=UPI001368D26C|nr:ABC transporter permease [Streptomyces sp. SID3343]MYW02343.1 FtsX-like permease family protein [Streptomyces sp. SID3343]
MIRSNGLARTSIRFRPASFAGSFVALLFAAMLVTMCGIFLESGLRAHVPPGRYADTPIVVAGPNSTHKTFGSGEDKEEVTKALPERARIDAGLATRIAAVPGVAAVLPDLTFPAQTPTAVLDAHPWSTARLAGTPQGSTPQGSTPHGNTSQGSTAQGNTARTGAAPRPGEAVLTTEAAAATKAAPGSTLRVTTPSGENTLRVAAVVPGDGARLYVADSEAPALAGNPGRVTAFGVLLADGASTGKVAGDLRKALKDTDVKVRTGDGRGEVDHPRLGDTKELLVGVGASFGGVVASVAVFVVAGATSLSVNQRRRDFALLRAVGATPWQIRRMITTETGFVALFAGVAGLLPGALLARWWFEQMRDRGMIEDGVSLSVSGIPMLAAVGAGVLSAVLAGLMAARSSARTKPTEALGEAGVERADVGWFRLGLGLVALVGAGALSGLAMKTSGDQAVAAASGVIMLFMLGIGLLGPLIAHLFVRATGVVLRRFGASGHLAFDNARANSRRLASAITPIALTVAFASTLMFMFAAQDHYSEKQSDAALTADRVLAGPGFPARTATDVARVPGVEAVTSVLNTSVVMAGSNDLTKYPTQAVGGTNTELARVLDLGVRQGSIDALRPGATQPPGGAVAMDRITADTVKAHVGKPVDIRLGDGTKIKPTLVATYDRGLGTAAVTFPRTTVEHHVDAAMDNRLLVRFTNGADPAAVDAALAKLTESHPGTTISDRGGYAAERNQDLETNKWTNQVMLVVLAGFATIAAVNTMIVSTAARRRELGLMRMIGSTRAQVRAVMRGEAALVGVIGLVLGLTVAMITLVPFGKGAFGESTPYVPIPLLLGISAAALLLAPLSVAPVTRRLLRIEPIDAVGAKE